MHFVTRLAIDLDRRCRTHIRKRASVRGAPRLSGTIGALGVGIIVTLGTAMPTLANEVTERLSVGPGGVQGNLNSFCCRALTGNGRFVAFSSVAGNLVAGDTDGWDVFVRDRKTRTTYLVSQGLGGVPGDDQSFGGSLSADGRFVAFASLASNLVLNDGNGYADMFVRDRKTQTTRLVSVGRGGAQGNDESLGGVISANGRFIAFNSSASNLVPHDTNHWEDVFVRDLGRGTTERISVSSAGAQGNSISDIPAISADGRFVAFSSLASNLVPGDTNGVSDVFVRDRQTGKTRRVSVGQGGKQGNRFSNAPAISANGRYVVFTSSADNLVPGDTNGAGDVFVHDLRSGATRRVSRASGGRQGNASSFDGAISPDGRYVAFTSEASNLVPNDTNGEWDIFRRDRRTGITERVSVGTSGVQGNGRSDGPGISEDGRVVAFESLASNLVPSDTNDSEDVFARVRPR
ncbi:MAG: hypothetical protein U1E52_18765 [Geminicoccaceae bacterium]